MLSAKWRAMQNEAQVAAEQIAHGITLLGKACYSQPGQYLQAFFCLSIGFERAGKIVFIADYAIRNQGRFPTDKDLRDIGHELKQLFSSVEQISQSLDQNRLFAGRPTDSIHSAIEDVLSLFATKSRYYNLNYLSGITNDQDDPISLWWQLVAAQICERHYKKYLQERDEASASMMMEHLNENTIIMHVSETGEEINSVYDYFSRAYATRVVQRFGQFYTIQIARWLTSIIYELQHQGAYVHRIEALLGMEEPFMMFFNEDSYLKTRKSWSTFRI